MDHRHEVMVKFSEMWPETFYIFDDMTAQACTDAVVELSVRHGGGRVLLGLPFYGEVQAQQHRLERVAQKQDSMKILSVGRMRSPAELPSRVEFQNIQGSILTKYRIAINQGLHPFGFICREASSSRTNPTSLGFFTMDEDTVEALMNDVESVLRRSGKRLMTFERLETFHQTTQKVARELESYSRRMELAVERARRRPDLLTPARFERIVSQAIAKMEELKELPLRAMRTMGKPRE